MNPDLPHSSSDDTDTRLPRRVVLQWFAATAAAASGGVTVPALSQDQAAPSAPSARSGKGYGTDPDLMKIYEPGTVWPLTFSESDKELATALADTVLPADDFGPAASQLRVVDFLDEWVSAPYPNQQRDRKLILPGLTQFDAAVEQQHAKNFADLSDADRAAFCESIIADEKHPLGNFFHRFTMIAAGAYYSSPEGWKALGYSGNMASGIFHGPPPEVLEKVGVEQTVA